MTLFYRYNKVFTKQFGLNTILSFMLGNACKVSLKRKSIMLNVLPKKISTTVSFQGSLKSYVNTSSSPLITDLLPTTCDLRTSRPVTLSCSTRLSVPFLITSNYLHSGGWTAFLHYNSYIDFLLEHNSFFIFIFFLLLLFH